MRSFIIYLTRRSILWRKQMYALGMQRRFYWCQYDRWRIPLSNKRRVYLPLRSNADLMPRAAQGWGSLVITWTMWNKKNPGALINWKSTPGFSVIIGYSDVRIYAFAAWQRKKFFMSIRFLFRKINKKVYYTRRRLPYRSDVGKVYQIDCLSWCYRQHFLCILFYLYIGTTIMQHLLLKQPIQI